MSSSLIDVIKYLDESIMKAEEETLSDNSINNALHHILCVSHRYDRALLGIIKSQQEEIIQLKNHLGLS